MAKTQSRITEILKELTEHERWQAQKDLLLYGQFCVMRDDETGKKKYISPQKAERVIVNA